MEHEPIPPFFFFEGGDLSIVPTMTARETWPEPIDVENEEFDIFDVAGRRLAARFEDDQLVLELIDDVRHEKEVRQRLAEYMGAIRRLPDVTLPFREFTQECARLFLEAERELQSRRWWKRRP